MAQQQVSAWVPQPPPSDTFAGRLRLLRLGIGDPSVEEMARRIGVPANNYRRWESGEFQPRGMAEVARKIQAATGVDIVWLVFGSAPPEQGLPRSLYTYVGAENVINLFPDVEPCDMQSRVTCRLPRGNSDGDAIAAAGCGARS